MNSLPPLDESAAAALRAALRQLGYDAAAVADAVPVRADLAARNPFRELMLPRPETPVAALCRLWILGLPLPAETAAQLLPADLLAAAERLGLLRVTADAVLPTAALVPLPEGWAVVDLPAPFAPRSAGSTPRLPPDDCDRWTAESVARDDAEPTLAVGPAADVLAGLFLRRGDFAVVAADEADRAAAERTRALLGATRLRVVGAELPAGERFRRFVGRIRLEEGFAATGSLTEAERLRQAAWEQVRTLLDATAAEGATVHLALQWPVPPEGEAEGPDDLPVAVADWAERAGWGAVLLRVDLDDALDWVARRLQAEALLRPSGYVELLDAALAPAADGARPVRRIATGTLCLRRTAAGGWFRREEIPNPRHLPWGGLLERILRQGERLRHDWGPDDPAGRARLLEGYFRTDENMSLAQTAEFSGKAWQVTVADAYHPEGLGFCGRMDILTMQLLPLLNGKRPLTDVIDRICRVLGIPRPKAEGPLLTNLAELLARGLVEPVDPPAAPRPDLTAGLVAE